MEQNADANYTKSHELTEANEGNEADEDEDLPLLGLPPTSDFRRHEHENV